MFYTRYTVDASASTAYRRALQAFVQRCGYHETNWRPNYGSWNFEGVYEGLRTRFWISRVEPGLFEVLFDHKWDFIGMFAPGAEVTDIGRDFERTICSVEGVRIAEGY